VSAADATLWFNAKQVHDLFTRQLGSMSDVRWVSLDDVFWGLLETSGSCRVLGCGQAWGLLTALASSALFLLLQCLNIRQHRYCKQSLIIQICFLYRFVVDGSSAV
jgi:hypothetical protein